jgi:hypothetical protein
MSLPIYVDAYSGYRANERPVRFTVDEQMFEIAQVEDRWYEPDAEYLKVRTMDGRRYILRYSERNDAWSLESGFDGAALFARPSITLITVEPETIREAEQRIAGCERCRGEEAELLFDWFLADVLGKHGPYEFVMSEPARCPNCKAELTEKSLVEVQGGIEVETHV